MRKTYGNTWWGKQWLNALTNIDYANRLPRGRTYANKGLARDIVIDGNTITAKVQGTRPRPYRVNFTVPEFSKRERAKIIDIIVDNPLHLSRLLNRTLPTALMQLCEQQQIQLFPDDWDGLSGSCSCPDYAVPCKHMAAVLYMVANEIDKNPFLVFELHDFDLFAELAESGYTATAEKKIPIPKVTALEQPFTQATNEKVWDDEVYQQLDFSKIPALREDLLTITSAKPVFYPQGDFKAILGKAYASVAKSLAKAKVEEPTVQAINEMDRTEEIEILLNEERAFLDVTLRDNEQEVVRNFGALSNFIDWLDRVPPRHLRHYSTALKSIWLTYQFARKLAAQSAIVPQLLQLNDRAYVIRWLPALLNPVVSSMFSGLRSIVATNVLYYRRKDAVYEPVAADKTLALTAVFLGEIVKRNKKLPSRFDEHGMVQLFFGGQLEVFSGYEAQAYPEAIQLWLNKFFLVEKEYVPVIQVDEDIDGEGFWINIAVQRQRDRLSVPVQLEDVLLQSKYADLRLNVLRDLALLAEYFPQINDLVATKGEDSLFFDNDGFVNVLFQVLPTIRLFGIKVLLPKGLRKLMRPQLSLVISSEEDSGVVAKSGLLNMDEMLAFQWKIALGEGQVSPAEFRELIKQYSGIVKLNEEYVFFDEQEIAKLIDKLENPPALNQKDLLQIALAEEYEGSKVKLDRKTQELMKTLLSTEAIAPPRGLRATLRAYQERGYGWLYKNARLGFGSLIADDMGLGKTLQVISLLLRLKEDGELAKRKAIVIVPTTLLTNWDKEIKKFAPDLIAHIYHGSNRKLEPLADADVLLTTYGVARSEVSKLQKHKWLILAIDEAQNIKNPGTAQTKAIKKIKAGVKIAMSGTPVENRLSEYWSIFDFTNKGYLGSLKNFKDDYAKPIEIERDHEKLERFRKITEPFILRRLKSDKSIIKDLPEKIEKDQFCSLTPAQTALYKSVVDNTLKAIETSEGIARKGLVLKLITALKQVCNHPRQFLKKGQVDPAASGKTKLLLELMREIQQNGEKTLIFTQYQEMGRILVEILEAEFGFAVPFLHGGVSRKGRDEMVESFQNDRATRIMILSLKAGGTGLNLTAASNVIHYDLWWNPAVEAQATDRAYRIGQKSNVIVHRFITEHTFEEKINQLLQSKKELANLTVSTGEKWIGEYGDEELRELVELS